MQTEYFRGNQFYFKFSIYVKHIYRVSQELKIQMMLIRIGLWRVKLAHYVHEEHPSSVETPFDCNIFRHSRISIHISSHHLYQEIKKYQLMGMKLVKAIQVAIIILMLIFNNLIFFLGDHWEVICYGEDWIRDLKVQFRHLDTRKFLGASGRAFGRPISVN